MDRTAVHRWLEGRKPDVPPVLAERLRSAVADHPEEGLRSAGSVPAALSQVGIRLLGEVTGRAPRESGLALDLLAADAFVTYAVEAAAEEGQPARGFALEIIHSAMSR